MGQHLWAVSVGSHPQAQQKLETYGITGERLVDGQTGSILFRHPELRGIPDLVVEGDGYTIRADSKCVPIALAWSSSLRFLMGLPLTIV